MTNLTENLRKAYEEINRRKYASLVTGTATSLEWAEAYHDASKLIEAAFLAAGVSLTETETITTKTPSPCL